MYSIDWAQLRSVIADKEARSGPSSTSSGPKLAGSGYGAAHSSIPADANPHPTPDPKSVAHRARMSIRELFRVHGTFARIEGDHLEFLLRTHAHRQLGYSTFGDFVREELQMSSRTATRRVALSRALRESAVLSEAVKKNVLSPCQALVLEAVKDEAELSDWIKAAAELTVAELSEAVRQKQGRESTEEDVCGRTVTFKATAAAAYVWDHGMELARRVLGWEAPVHRCVEAVLAEVTTELSGDTAEHMCSERPMATPVLKSSRVQRAEEPAPTLRWSERFEALDESLTATEEELKVIHDISRTSPESEERSLEVIRGLKRHERSLRILFAQILQDADCAGVIAFWGYRSISDFMVGELKVSERTARRYMSEAWTFDGNPALSHAYCSGRIGLGQAYLVNRVASASTQGAFIRRAEVVTHLQFEREVLFLERLAVYWPTLARRFPGPLPIDLLEHALKEGLRELGWPAEKIEDKFGPMIADDPASNSAAMGTLELLLESFVLALEERDMAVRDGAPMSSAMLASSGKPGGDVLSATLALRLDPAADALSATLASSGKPGGDVLSATLALNDQSSGNVLPALPTLSAGGRATTISFWAPEPLITQWNETIAVVQGRHGPLPTWAAAIYILQIAVREWERLDPARRPSEWKILERDTWRCQAPGCSARRQLEVHHVVFRSHGGTDDPENLTTLCHAHHQHGIHGEGLHLEGTAPAGLRWRLGENKWFHGSRRISVPIPATDISQKAQY